MGKLEVLQLANGLNVTHASVKDIPNVIAQHISLPCH